MVFKSLKSALGNRSNSNGPINLPPVPTLDIETLPEKRSRTLKHLIKANHATKSIIGKDGEPNDISIVSSRLALIIVHVINSNSILVLHICWEHRLLN